MDFVAENGNTPPATVYSEDLTGAIYLDKPSEIDVYEQVWAALDRLALNPRAIYDPLVLAHARNVLAGTGGDAADYLDADLRDPAALLAAVGRTGLDLSRPTGLILMNILGHVAELDEAVAIVRDLMTALPPGSYLITADGTNVIDGPAFEEAIGVWNANAPLSYHLRPPAELARFLDGLEVVEPGLVPCSRWRPAPDAEDLREVDEFGAVARKP